MDIVYQIENNLATPDFIDVLVKSGLAARRPVEDLARIGRMLENANLIYTARQGGKLIGVARSITDFAYCTYLSDLAVDQAFQFQGIGKELIRKTWEAAPQAKLILLSAPAATAYYPKIGMERHPFCYFLDDGEKIN